MFGPKNIALIENRLFSKLIVDFHIEIILNYLPRSCTFGHDQASCFNICSFCTTCKNHNLSFDRLMMLVVSNFLVIFIYQILSYRLYSTGW